MLDTASGETTNVWAVPPAQIDALAISPDGRRLASGSADGVLRIWELSSGQEAATLSGHTGRIMSLDWNPDGERVISGSADFTARIWDLRSRRSVAELKMQDWVRSVAYSPNGRWIATGSGSGFVAAEGAVQLWDAQTAHLLARLPLPSGNGGNSLARLTPSSVSAIGSAISGARTARS